MLQKNMIRAPDILTWKYSTQTERMFQLAVGKENIGSGANKSDEAQGVRPQERALSESVEHVPRIGLAQQQFSSNSGKLLIVEGNIGVGKSTLTQAIANELNYKLFLEPATENPFLGRCHDEPLISRTGQYGMCHTVKVSARFRH